MKVKKYKHGGEHRISKRDYDALMDLVRSRMTGYADPRTPTPRPYHEMTPRERFLEAERISDPYGYYVGQIEGSNLPRLVRGVDQPVTGMDYGSDTPGGGRARREEMMARGRNLVAEHLRLLEGEHDPSEFGYSRNALRRQIESQYDTPHEGPLSRKRDEVLRAFDEETDRLRREFVQNARRRSGKRGMKYRILKK